MISKKEQIKELMLKYFGPASAKMVDLMKGTDDQILEDCKKKALALLGSEKAKDFDNIK